MGRLISGVWFDSFSFQLSKPNWIVGKMYRVRGEQIVAKQYRIHLMRDLVISGVYITEWGGDNGFFAYPHLALSGQFY